ncbi:MAG: Uma2 family endonuclease [Actinobacteria bacterium]|nr:Uma2 family endonuclease [Actinomycetota bacterium]MBO0834832.1 Uma2 family endonuclease [Actinomycetota bacterium]
MRTVVLDPVPAEVEELIERRRALGLDLFDEVWEGTYHMAPAPRFRHAYLDDALSRILGPYAEAAGLTGTGPFNLGKPDDFRVPDKGYHRGKPDPEAVYLSTAAVVVEIVSPGDETYDKLPFYAAHGVDEVLLADPAERRIRVLALAGDDYREADASAVLGIRVGDLQDLISWP